jgi:hypothetical protein
MKIFTGDQDGVVVLTEMDYNKVSAHILLPVLAHLSTLKVLFRLRRVLPVLDGRGLAHT